MLLPMSLALAAPVVQPPLNALWDQDTVLGEATFVGQPEPGFLLFRDIDVVHGGESRGELRVRADAKALELVEPGRRYVLAWQETRRSPSSKKLRIVRPEGAQLLDSVGVSPALFEANDEIRALLLSPPEAEQLQGHEYLQRVLKQLASGDPRMQQLFAGELFARTGLLSQLDSRSQAWLRRFVRDRGNDLVARDLVLQAAHLHPQSLGEGWDALAARLLTREPASMSPGQANEGLVWTAFALVESAQRSLPVRVSQRWVRSGNGALAEQALRALRRDAPQREEAAIASALADPALAEGTRALLLDHRRRLVQNSMN